MEGFNLDRKASNLDGMTDVQIQAKIFGDWRENPDTAPECTFYK